jgi:hypothetical protein
MRSGIISNQLVTISEGEKAEAEKVNQQESPFSVQMKEPQIKPSDIK